MGRFIDRNRPTWLALLAGRDLMRGDGYVLALIVVARPDLMTPEDEGRQILTGLRMEVRFRWPYHPQLPRGLFHWRSPVVVCSRSDAEEIALRLASQW